MSNSLGLNSKILIVDDLASMRADLVKILNELGFKNLKEFPDGKPAWEDLKAEAAAGRPYDIVFSDINMPEMSGLVLLKYLRATPAYKTTPIFMVSTENEKQTIIKAILEGATDYIIKPYDPWVVKEKLVLKLLKNALNG